MIGAASRFEKGNCDVIQMSFFSKFEYKIELGPSKWLPDLKS